MNQNRYDIPDHDFSNPQTSINIINNNEVDGNNEKASTSNESVDINEKLNANDDSVEVFGEDLDIPAYLRNNR